MLTIIGLVVTGAIVTVLMLAARKPDTFRVERAITIKAPAEKVFAFINDFNQWRVWSPWEKKDPAMQRTIGRVSSGNGATYAWDGNKAVGQGSMEITESLTPSKIALKLEFIKPFTASNTVDFTLTPNGDTTDVRWSMQGPTPFMMKIAHLFMNMDKLVGRDFEAGLADLKTVAEK